MTAGAAGYLQAQQHCQLQLTLIQTSAAVLLIHVETSKQTTGTASVTYYSCSKLVKAIV
jgi:hypothetical protein